MTRIGLMGTLALMGCGLSSAEAAENDVKLEGSELVRLPVAVAGGHADVCMSRSCQHETNTVDIVVDNLAYEKSVTLHILKPDGSWADVAASYVRSLAGGKELWSAVDRNTFPLCPTDAQFAVRYDVNGKTYWDNNNGRNYHLYGCGPMLTDAFPVQLQNKPWMTDYGTNQVGTIYVKNLAYEKKLEVIFTTDAWKTTNVAATSFSETVNSANGVERWTFQFPAAAWSAAPIEFAISYTVAGKTFWDVMNGQNYTVTLSP